MTELADAMRELFFRPVPSTPAWVIGARLAAFAAATAGVWAASIRLANRALPGEGAGDRLLAAFQIAVCHIILFLLVVAALPLPGEFGASFYYALIFLAVEFAAIGRLPWAEKTSDKGQPAGNFLWLAIPALVAFSFGAAWALVSPPPFSDAFLYHLTYPARWLQEGRMVRVATYFGDRSWPWFPPNAQLLYLWAMAPLFEDVLTNLVPWIFHCVAAFIVFVQIGEAGGPKGFRAAGAAAVLALPFLFRQSFDSGSDVIFSTFFLLSFHWATTLRKGRGDPARRWLAWTGIALTVGTKYLGLLYAAPLILLAAGRPRPTAKQAALIGASIIVFGLWWYFRNWMETGNPVYPLMVRAGNLILLPGEYDRAALMKTPYFASGLKGFLGTALMLAAPKGAVLLILGGIGAAWIVRLIKERTPFDPPHLLVAGTVTALFWFLNVNKSYECARFLHAAVVCALAYPFVALAQAGRLKWLALAVLAGSMWALQADEPSRRILQMMGRLVVTYALWPQRGPGLLTLAGLGLAFLAIFLRNRTSGRAWKWKAVGLAAVALLLAAVMQTDGIFAKQKIFWYASTPSFGAWRDVEKATGDGATVAVAGTSMTYGFYGRRFKNRVIYVAPTGEADGEALSPGMEKGRPFDMHPFQAKSRMSMNVSRWAAAFKREGVDYLVLLPLHRYQRSYGPHTPNYFPLEAAMARNRPDVFEPIVENPNWELYAVKQAPPAIGGGADTD